MSHEELGRIITEGYGCKAFRLPVVKPIRFSSARYAKRLGVSLKAMRRLGGRGKMRAMPPSARKFILRCMLKDVETSRLKDEAAARKKILTEEA